jgi:hypothetical protein
MIMLQTPVSLDNLRPAGIENPLTQATKGTGQHIAVATRQKSTARRFVSILAVLEGTYLMLFTGATAVTTWPAGTEPVGAWLGGKFTTRSRRWPRRPPPPGGPPYAADLTRGW